MTLATVNDIAQLLANVATFLGIPIAIIAYLRERTKDGAEKEIDAFGTLNAAYMDYLRLCLDHPQMSWYGRAKIDGRKLSDVEIRDYRLQRVLSPVPSCEQKLDPAARAQRGAYATLLDRAPVECGPRVS